MRLSHSAARASISLAFAGLMLAAAPAIAQTTAPATAPESMPAKDLPKAKEVFQRNVDAMGGKKALESIESSMLKASMEIPGMGAMNMDQYFAKPGKFLIVQSSAMMPESRVGSDGKVGWMFNPMMGGHVLIDGEELEASRDDANMLDRISKMGEEHKNAETVDKVSFNNQDTYKVHMTDENGNEQDAYFSVESGLIQGVEMKQESQMGPMVITMTFLDWKPVGDVKMFHKVNIDQGGMMNIDMNFKEIKFNDVDASVFELPEEVKQLVAERDAKPTPQPE